MDGLLRNSKLASRRIDEGPISVLASDMYKGFKAISKILDLIKDAPNNTESAGLLRDVLLAGCFFETEHRGLVEFLKQGVEVEGHLLAKELGGEGGKILLRECIGTLGLWRAVGPVTVGSPTRKSPTKKRGGADTVKIPIAGCIGVCLDGNVDEEVVAEVRTES